MKPLSLEELYKKVMASDKLKKEYFTAARQGRVAEFLGAHDCGATLEELQSFLASPKALPQGELCDDELDSVAGGTCYYEGRPVVTVLNSCEHWRCDRCGGTTTGTGHYSDNSNESCVACGNGVACMNCAYCRYEDALWQCYNPARKGN